VGFDAASGKRLRERVVADPPHEVGGRVVLRGRRGRDRQQRRVAGAVQLRLADE
jgi:hypothetical protein